MTALRRLSVSFRLSGVVGSTFAQAPLTRHQVTAKLAQALRDVQQGDGYETFAMQFPLRYATARLNDGETRLAMN